MKLWCIDVQKMLDRIFPDGQALVWLLDGL